MKLKLSPPMMITWIIALVLGVLALLGQFAIAAIAPFAFWLAIIGLALMLVATTVKGL